MASTEPNLVLYTSQTPNGIKISIALEELGLPYKTIKIDMTKTEQKSDWFLAVNPNGRIPALSDNRPPFSATAEQAPMHLWESGSILLYLTTHYDAEHKISFPVGTREWHDMVSWVFFQNAGLGPMQGQANHFTRYAPEPLSDHAYGQARYQNETRRLYRVMETQLSSDGGRQFLVGDKCTIADITAWGWVGLATWAGVDIGEFPALKAWEERLGQRAAFQRGMNVPEPNKTRELLKDPVKMAEQAAKGRHWVQKGMKEDAQK